MVGKTVFVIQAKDDNSYLYSGPFIGWAKNPEGAEFFQTANSAERRCEKLPYGMQVVPVSFSSLKYALICARRMFGKALGWSVRTGWQILVALGMLWAAVTLIKFLWIHS